MASLKPPARSLPAPQWHDGSAAITSVMCPACSASVTIAGVVAPVHVRCACTYVTSAPTSDCTAVSRSASIDRNIVRGAHSHVRYAASSESSSARVPSSGPTRRVSCKMGRPVVMSTALGSVPWFSM